MHGVIVGDEGYVGFSICSVLEGGFDGEFVKGAERGDFGGGEGFD